MAWREKFEQEMKVQLSSKGKDTAQQTQKLTGATTFPLCMCMMVVPTHTVDTHVSELHFIHCNNHYNNDTGVLGLCRQTAKLNEL